MTKPRVPRDLLDPVVEYFKPQRVILFGLRARGEATRDSDIDLLVVVDDDTPPEKLTSKSGYEARRSSRAADVFPVRAETFERERNIVNTLAAEADLDGIVVYGSPNESCMKTPDPRARWQAVDDWLAVANEDRRVAALCLAADPPLRGVAAFRCQQVVEKLLKGFLTLAGSAAAKRTLWRSWGRERRRAFRTLPSWSPPHEIGATGLSIFVIHRAGAAPGRCRNRTNSGERSPSSTPWRCTCARPIPSRPVHNRSRTPGDPEYLVSVNPRAPVQAEEVWTFGRRRCRDWLLSGIRQV